MTGHVCGVLAVEVTSCSAQAVREALAPMAEWLVAGDPEATSACDILLMIGQATAFDTLLAAVRDRRQTAPGSALVVVGDGLDAGQLGALLEAGAFDVLDASRLDCELAPRLRRALGGDSLVSLAAVTGVPARRLPGLIHAGPPFAQVTQRILAFAACDANVLIVGETGTGKEVCARAIHYQSRRADQPWVAVNCGAIPNELVESELFGHVKGAFTTALAARVGLIREAEGGTLFLDDVDCLPLAAQAKLLRFLQEGEYRLVGSNAVQHADVRVLAACNRSLGELVKRGEFRQDLLFRLNVLRLALPPLRERRDDLPLLAQHFTRHFARKLDKRLAGLTPGALQRLLAHDWPGNVRELQHVIERGVLLAGASVLSAADIDIDIDGDEAQPLPEDDSAFKVAKQRLVDRFERNYIERLLQQHQGNVTRAAEAAKKNRRAFFELMRKHRIDSGTFRV
jgi:DNA-binding NtrC family response regulator